MYFKVSGCYPFENPQHPDNVSYTLANVRDGKYRQLPSNISAPCADLIYNMLRKKVNKRITLTNIPRHPWMKQQMIDLTKNGNVLPGLINLHDILKRNSNSGWSTRQSFRQTSIKQEEPVDEKTNNVKQIEASRSLSHRNKVSPRTEKPNPQKGQSITKSASKEKEDITSKVSREAFRFGKLNFFGSRRAS